MESYDSKLTLAQLARSKKWRSEHVRVKKVFTGILRNNVDVRSPVQAVLTADAECEIVSERGGLRLHMPVDAVNRYEKLGQEIVMPVPDSRWSAPDWCKDHAHDLKAKAERLFAAAKEIERDWKRIGWNECEVKPSALNCRRLAGAYQDMVGGYYVKHRPASKDNALVKAPEGVYMENWAARRERAEAADAHEIVWACDEIMSGHSFVAGKQWGLPELISDFYIEPLFILKRCDSNKQSVVRMVNIHNKYGEFYGFHPGKPFGPNNRPLEICGDDSASPTKFRAWLGNRANGEFGAGEREWQAIKRDQNQRISHTGVMEVSQWGWHEDSASWFMSDCVVPDDCKGVVPPAARVQKQGFFRIGSGRYIIGERDREKKDWQLKDVLPRMYPEIEITLEEVRELAIGMADQCERYVGGFEGVMAFGHILAYGAAPEIHKTWRMFGGQWVHGEKGKGKSTFANFLTAIFGWGAGGLDVSLGSVAALENAVAQFSNLPVLLEEYQTEVKKGIEAVMKACFDRSIIPKMLEGMNGRQPGTAPIVVGQATTGDSAAKSRYLHVPVVIERREAMAAENNYSKDEPYEWLRENRPNFWKIGRWIIGHRTKFKTKVLDTITEWMSAADTKRVRDNRARLIHGVAYAGLVGLWEILGVSANMVEPLKVLREQLIDEALRSHAEVQEQVELSRFFQKLANWVTTGDYRKTGEDDATTLARYFRIKVVESELPPDVAEDSTQTGPWYRPHDLDTPMALQSKRYYANRYGEGSRWLSVEVSICRSEICGALARWVSGQGERLPLRENDITAQMREKPWYVAPKVFESGDAAKVRFAGKRRTTPWIINLDRFPELGYNPVSEAEWREWYEGTDGRLAGKPDPRLGPLHVLVNYLLGISVKES